MKHLFRLLYFTIMTLFCFALVTDPTPYNINSAAFIIMLGVVTDIIRGYIED